MERTGSGLTTRREGERVRREGGGEGEGREGREGERGREGGGEGEGREGERE